MRNRIKRILGEEIVQLIHSIYPLSKSKISLLLIRHKFKHFGKKSTIIFPSVFFGHSNISIGELTDIGAFANIWGNGGVYIGNHVMIASHVTITSMTHDYNQSSMKLSPAISKPIYINDDVWIGSHAVILPGITIGKGAVVGAGSIVTKDVNPFEIVAGNPAKVIKKREFEHETN